MRKKTDYEVIIIGASFAGLGACIRLKMQGYTGAGEQAIGIARLEIEK